VFYSAFITSFTVIRVQKLFLNCLVSFVSRRTRGAAVGQWEAAYYKLVPGYYRLVIEAKAGTAAESMNVAVDDLDIGPCGLSK